LLQRYRSQWSSGNMPHCGVIGPRFESHRGQLHVSGKNYDIQPWARAAHPYPRETENAGPQNAEPAEMTDQIAGLENTRPNHFARSYVLFHERTKSYKQCVVMPKNR